MSAVRHVMLYAANALNFLCRPTDSSSAGICEPDMVRSADEKSARSLRFCKIGLKPISKVQRAFFYKLGLRHSPQHLHTTPRQALAAAERFRSIGS